jgi:acetyl-CoA synthetase
MMDENVNEIEGNQVVGSYVLNSHGLGLQEQFGVTINDIKMAYFSAFPGTYFTGDALRDEVGYYRITVVLTM